MGSCRRLYKGAVILTISFWLRVAAMGCPSLPCKGIFMATCFCELSFTYIQLTDLTVSSFQDPCVLRPSKPVTVDLTLLSLLEQLQFSDVQQFSSAC